MKRTVTIIGNNGSGAPLSDGGRIKLRLFRDLLVREGISVNIIELDGWKKHPIGLIASIRKSVRKGDTILIMGGPKGCRVVIPLVCFFNKKRRARAVFCLLGVGTLDAVIKGLPEEDVSRFLKCEDFFGLHDEKMGRRLQSLDAVIPENEQLVTVYRNFYGLNNLCMIRNFRDVEIQPRDYKTQGVFRIVFFARVCASKGIFDLLDAVSLLIDQGFDIELSIYGELQFDEEEGRRFQDFLDERVIYKGTIASSESISTLATFDLFCLPTRYYGEGTPGSLIEAFIAGTPVLISSYSQSSLFVPSKEYGLVFEIGNTADLIEKLRYAYNNWQELAQMGVNGQSLGKKYVYAYNRKDFLSGILGEDDENPDHDC